MSKRLVSIARKTGGIGGMQRLQQDLERGLEAMSDLTVITIRPYATIFDPTFLFRALLAARTSVVHLGDASLAFLIPVLRILGARRIVVTACGLDVVYPNAFYQWMLRMVLPRADHIIAISRATAASVVHRGIAPQKVSVIPCGIWDADVSNSTRTGLVSVCRLVPRKGIAWFLEHVFPMILEQEPETHWTIVGEGPERAKVEQLRKELQLERSITIRGAVSEEEKKHILDRHCMFLMPNIQVPGNMEGFGISCIEASSRGLCVAAARLEGIQDAVLDQRTGKFFRAGDPDDAARVTLELLKNPLPPTDVSAHTLRNYSWEILIPRYVEVFFPAT